MIHRRSLFQATPHLIKGRLKETQSSSKIDNEEAPAVLSTIAAESLDSSEQPGPSSRPLELSVTSSGYSSPQDTQTESSRSPSQVSDGRFGADELMETDQDEVEEDSGKMRKKKTRKSRTSLGNQRRSRRQPADLKAAGTQEKQSGNEDDRAPPVSCNGTSVRLSAVAAKLSTFSSKPEPSSGLPGTSSGSQSQAPEGLSSSFEQMETSQGEVSEASGKVQKNESKKSKTSVENPRRSRRQQADLEGKGIQEKQIDEKEMEDAAPIKLDFGVIPPIGLQRKWFDMREVSSRKSREIDNLNKTDRVGFRPYLMADEQKDARIGPGFQVEIPDEPTHSFGQEEDLNREEAFWIPETVEYAPKEVLEADQIRNVYWTAIWQQWKGHIPFEIALKHLMECKYNTATALDSIDQTLKGLPQEMRPVGMAQARSLLDMHKATKKTDKRKRNLREIQQYLIKNYHLGEIQNFRYQLSRFYYYQPTHGVPCNCRDRTCTDYQFEPRVGCTNCNRHHRPHLPADCEKLCLICKMYLQLKNKMRPAEQVVFNSSELEFLEVWNQKETEMGGRLTRDDVEQLIRMETWRRWADEDLTDEEEAMLNLSKLVIRNRAKSGKHTEEEKRIKGSRIVHQLRPLILPLFTKCCCMRSGSIPHGSVNRDKWSFSEKEVEKYRDLVSNFEGDQFQISRLLKVEPELVERFVKKYPENYEIWKEKQFFPLNPREIFQPHNLAPIIPSFVYDDTEDGDGEPSSKKAKKAKKARKV
ncbi:Protein CBG21614 [Caenorhabditis briggsae]|uniref:Protein CBG21614 n=2 Tax=Caenorhabditis briggsae TaxID=6238 RepID=A8Y076_CAEBR|nr:Protein CBG21614 [Caenorhabditis briggsae]ULT93514.1 hypothetical protein L3Y34_003184 [Caenorhabditis briggsae]CAP38366.2 Protein CBG21614 [Caenorhabditis briggsae]